MLPLAQGRSYSTPTQTRPCRGTTSGEAPIHSPSGAAQTLPPRGGVEAIERAVVGPEEKPAVVQRRGSTRRPCGPRRPGTAKLQTISPVVALKGVHPGRVAAPVDPIAVEHRRGFRHHMERVPTRDLAAPHHAVVLGQRRRVGAQAQPEVVERRTATVTAMPCRSRQARPLRDR